MAQHYPEDCLVINSSVMAHFVPSIDSCTCSEPPVYQMSTAISHKHRQTCDLDLSTVQVIS